MSKTEEKAGRFVGQLRANADAFCADRVSYEAFSAANRGTWDAIRAAGATVERRVLKILRDG